MLRLNLCSVYILVTNSWTEGSEGLMAHTSEGFREKVGCQMKCCIFLMGHVKPGLVEL